MEFKTAIVEREALGGVCLNVGCIPSKAMITATHLLHKAQHDFKTMGLNIKGGIEVDMKKLVSWKQGVCDKMSGGVNQLLKGNSVTVIKGTAEFKSPTELSISSASGKDSATAKYFIIATGSRPIEIPGFPFDEKDICSSTGALAFDALTYGKTLVLVSVILIKRRACPFWYGFPGSQAYKQSGRSSGKAENSQP